VADIRPFPKLCVSVSCNADVARELRVAADCIERGDYGEVRGTVTCIEAEGQIWRYTAGPADGYSRMEVAGLLTWALNNLMND
jgi:hypothetical protein